MDGEILQVYLGSSPKPLCPYGRNDDLTIITEAINQAEKFLFVAVADYAPFNQFGKMHSWTILQDLLLNAKKRGLKIRMILSERAYTYKDRRKHLLELKENHIEIKVFQVIILNSISCETFGLAFHFKEPLLMQPP